MKNQFKIIALFLIGALFLTSCSSNDDGASSSQFKVNGQSYDLLPTSAVTEIKMDNVHTVQGQIFDRSTITIMGLTGFNFASVSFDLYYKDGSPIAGTYNIGDTEGDNSFDFDNQLLAEQKLCLGWTSACTYSDASNGLGANANNPTGTVTVVDNGNSNYSIQYNGDFRKYDSSFNVTGNVPVVINITSDVLIQ
ncbi:hypothetical protein ACFSX9_00840 [Flavobacterium ardleyense]|uniref:Lipoprotein n=1 Tax=Flavobacterium ardleyense TaxID=2038737 RepID=A0ABW5Z3W6_9FLAO